MALLYALAGVVTYILITTVPFGLQAFKLAARRPSRQACDVDRWAAGSGRAVGGLAHVEPSARATANQRDRNQHLLVVSIMMDVGHRVAHLSSDLPGFPGGDDLQDELRQRTCPSPARVLRSSCSRSVAHQITAAGRELVRGRVAVVESGEPLEGFDMADR